jgi:nucleoside-diphosphate-sugar epimerase
MKREKILVIGACGQIGAELTTSLRHIFGNTNVIAADLRSPVDIPKSTEPYVQLDVLNKRALGALIDRHDITQVYLLAAMLSATGERNPQKAWDLNMQSLLNILDLAREKELAKVFWPSSIAVYGPGAPRRQTPQNIFLDPATVYGISKAAGENWCNYYWKKYGVDTRSLRYPGLISHQAEPGGGTTDYAVDIFRQALQHQSYSCYLRPDTCLPMMYMPDAIRATLELMESPVKALTIRTSYNISALSFTPEQLAGTIRQYIPDFTISYQPDYRQAIADSWPESIDDTPAKNDWRWDYEYGISATAQDMLKHLAKKSKTLTAI